MCMIFLKNAFCVPQNANHMGLEMHEGELIMAEIVLGELTLMLMHRGGAVKMTDVPSNLFVKSFSLKLLPMEACPRFKPDQEEMLQNSSYLLCAYALFSPCIDWQYNA